MALAGAHTNPCDNTLRLHSLEQTIMQAQPPYCSEPECRGCLLPHFPRVPAHIMFPGGLGGSGDQGTGGEHQMCYTTQSLTLAVKCPSIYWCATSSSTGAVSVKTTPVSLKRL